MLMREYVRDSASPLMLEFIPIKQLVAEYTGEPCDPDKATSADIGRNTTAVVP
jgi:hypothetical protein